MVIVQRKILIVCIACIALAEGAVSAVAQTKDSTRSEVQRDLEDALESFDPNDPNFDSEQLTQILQDLASNPLNINRVTTDNLLLIPGVNLQLARAIVNYRDDVKPFETIEELTEVSGIGPATLERMRPYVSVGSGLELGRALYTDINYWTSGGGFEVFSRYQQTLQEQEGYTRPDDEGGYLGNPVQYYQRFRYRSDHVSLNLTQQKDAGEPIAGTTGFDYNSWHLALEDNGKLRDFVVGDYALYFGQGLVLWNGRTFGKGREVIGTANRGSRGVRAYSSSQESNAYRGVAATYGGDFQVTGFYSFRNQSASTISPTVTRGVQEDGFHRTQNERDQRDNLKQKLYGGRLRMEFPFGFIGATGYRTSFNKIVSGGSRNSDQFDFSGQHTSALGVDYTILAGPAIVFGEAARSQNGGLGFISGIETTVGINTELTMAYRNYAKDFQSILGNGFGESSGQPKNEEGFYIGLRHALNENITLSGYFDQFRSPAASFGTSQPTQGYDWLALGEVNINRDLQFYIQLRSETEDDEFEVIDDFGRTQTSLGDAQRGSIRGQLQYQVNPKIRLRTRGEVVRSRQAGEDVEYGFLMYQDLRFIPSEKWSIDTRITVYDTDSFDTRVYQFENDLLYVLSNQVLFNQGQRLYLLVNYEPFSYMEVWAKFGITIFENEQRISSGRNEIQGNERSDIGLQIRLQF
jgi:competence ComEA-like helix-hairpin-helix protein